MSTHTLPAKDDFSAVNAFPTALELLAVKFLDVSVSCAAAIPADTFVRPFSLSLAPSTAYVVAVPASVSVTRIDGGASPGQVYCQIVRLPIDRADPDNPRGKFELHVVMGDNAGGPEVKVQVGVEVLSFGKDE